MKIEGPQGTQKTGSARKSGSVSDVDVSLFRGLMAAGGTEGATPMAPAHQIAALDTLLAVQGTEDPGARAARGRMVARGHAVLDVLDGIRRGLLAGTLTVGDMVNVADVVASHRDRVDDPYLTQVMDEIDLRAQVEIAKLRYALDTLNQ